MHSRLDRSYFTLLFVMTKQQFTSRYKQAIFGLLWVLLNPLLQMLIMGAVFSLFVKIPNYFIFLFSGLLPWQFFSMSLTQITSSFVSERSLLHKVAFPHELIPLSMTATNLINFILSTLIFLLFIALLLPLSLLPLLMLIPAIIWLTGLTIGCSLITSSLNVRFRDVSFFTQTLTTLWFYCTPIFYSLHQLPTQLQKTIILNPLVGPLSLIKYSIGLEPLLSTGFLQVNFLTGVVCVIIGVIIFKRESPYFVDWI